LYRGLKRGEGFRYSHVGFVSAEKAKSWLKKKSQRTCKTSLPHS